MRKLGFVTSLIIAGAVSFAIVGCGSSSGGSTATTVKPIKGPIYNATVMDAQGNVAKETNGTAEYVFEKAVTYPISVYGGWADQNYNGKFDNGDIKNPSPMKSFTNVITPVTTLAAKNAKTKEEFEKNLETIAEKYNAVAHTNITAQDLEKGGVDASLVVNILNLSLYPDISDIKSVNDVNYNSLFNTVSKFNIPDNANSTSEANESVLAQIESQLYDNTNVTKETVTPEDQAFQDALSKIPVFDGNPKDGIRIYNNINQEHWEILAKSEYSNGQYEEYRSDYQYQCNENFNATELGCQVVNYDDAGNIANIIFIYNSNATNSHNSEESSSSVACQNVNPATGECEDSSSSEANSESSSESSSTNSSACQNVNPVTGECED